MKKLIAEIFELPNGSLLPQLYCIDEDGQVSRSITDTLLDTIAELSPKAATELDSFLAVVESGRYEPQELSLPDWSINEKLIWVTPPRARRGYLVITNENIPEYSLDDGQPQEFSMQQFRSAMAHWKNFQKLVQKKGKESLVGEKFEVDF